MENSSVFQHALHVGPNYIDHKGGIGAVIATYHKNISNFNFISSYDDNLSSLANVPYFLLSVIKIFKTLLIQKRINLVHIHCAHKGSVFRKYIVFFISKYIFSKKVIYHSHGSDFHIFYHESNTLVKRFIRNFLSKIDLVICLSGQWKTFFESNFTLKRIVVLENIIDANLHFIKDENREVLRALFLGQIGDRKGIFDLLEVIGDNKPYFTGKITLAVGGNGQVKRLEDFVEKHALQNIVKFEGWVTGEKKDQLLSSSDVYILPSYNEGLPISILEAMSYRLPIISTNVGGISEIVHDGRNGFLLEPGDRKSMLNSLRAFIDNRSLIKTMGMQSELMVKPHYSDAVIDKLESLYNQILV